MIDEFEAEGKQRRPRSVSNSGGSGIMGIFKRKDSKGKEQSSPPSSGRRHSEEYEMVSSPLHQHQQPLLTSSSSGTLATNIKQQEKTKSKKSWRPRTNKRQSVLVSYSKLEQMRHRQQQQQPLVTTSGDDYYTKSHIPQQRMHGSSFADQRQQHSGGGGGGETTDIIKSDVVNPELKTIELKVDRIINKIDYLAAHIIRTNQVVLNNEKVLEGIVVDYGDDVGGGWLCCGFC